MTQASVFSSFKATLKSLLNPRIWGFLMLPAALTLGSFVLLLLLCSWWLYDLIDSAILWFDWLAATDAWLERHIAWGLEVWLTPLITVAVLLVVANLISLSLMSMFFDTAMIMYIKKRYYPDLQDHKEIVLKDEIAYNIKLMLVIIPCAFISIALWLIAPLAIAWTILYNGLVQSRLMSFSALLEFATKKEISDVRATHRKKLFWVGACASVFNFIPLLGLFTSGVSIIWFSHFCLHALSHHRKNSSTSGIEASNDQSRLTQSPELIDTPAHKA